MRIWTVTDGKAGHVNQCLGLAEALGGVVETHTVVARAPWRWLPPRLWWMPEHASKTPLTPPWPDLALTAGRSAVAVGAWLRRQGVPVVAVQDPKLPPSWFDLVVAPAHDRLSGPTVIETIGAPTRLTAARLAEAAGEFAPLLADLPRPLAAVLLGGSNARFTFDRATGERLAADLTQLAQSGVGLAITASRRTDPAVAAVLRDALKGLPHLWWDGSGANPYLGFLALADHLIVTLDSVSMLSEAASTGKPVHGVALPGNAGKFATFHRRLEQHGALRPFRLPLETWRYPALDDTAQAAAEIRRRLFR
jgi:mitochondrial fission protein ELM1